MQCCSRARVRALVQREVAFIACDCVHAVALIMRDCTRVLIVVACECVHAVVLIACACVHAGVASARRRTQVLVVITHAIACMQ